MTRLAIALIPTLLVALAITSIGCGGEAGEPTPTVALDSDGDGWTDSQEEIVGTDSHRVDTDGDGYWDPHDANPLDTTIPGPLSIPSYTPIRTPSPSATAIPTPSPTPTPPFAPGEGAAEGRLLYKDGAPAQGCTVFIFWEHKTGSYASNYVDANGYYHFAHLPVGGYDIHTTCASSPYIVQVFGGAPAAEITVHENETTTVPTITRGRSIIVSCQNEYITTSQPTFSWDAVPADYYLVEVRAEEEYGDYSETRSVSDTHVTWSELALGRYRVVLHAYHSDYGETGSGSKRFWIGPSQTP